MEISSITRKGYANIENADKFNIIDDTYFILADGASGNISPSEPSNSFVNFLSEKLTFGVPESYVGLIRDGERNFLFEGVYGETTGVVFEINNKKIKGSSVGDSEVWLYREGELTEITEKQNRRPRIGSFGPFDITPVMFEMELKENDIIIAGTDGLFNFVPSQKIKEIIESKNFNVINSCMLKEAMVDGKLEDDFTAITIKI